MADAATVQTSSKPTALLMSLVQESIRSQYLLIATHPTWCTDLKGNVAAFTLHIYLIIFVMKCFTCWAFDVCHVKIFQYLG